MEYLYHTGLRFIRFRRALITNKMVIHCFIEIIWKQNSDAVFYASQIY